MPAPQGGTFLIILANSIAQRQKLTHMVTGDPEQIRHYPNMMTATQKEIPYCSTTTSSGKQKKAHSTNQAEFRSENTPATIEADQILLALQQLATNSKPKSLTTTMPTFDEKSEKFELFEDLFQTSLKIHNQLTEEDKRNYFPSLMRGDALQTFKNITSPNRDILGEILTVFCRKYEKPQSMATAKHKFQRLVFNPTNQKLNDFLDELQKLAKDAFRVAAQAIIEHFIYAKMPPHLKKWINPTHLEKGTYEQIVSHLERELELNGLEALHEVPINTVTQQAPHQNSNKPKPTCHHCKKLGHYQNQCRQLKREKDQTRNNTNSATITMVVPKQTLTPTTKLPTIPKPTIQIFKETEDLDLSFHPVRHVVEPSTPQRNATLEQTQQIYRLPGIDDAKDITKSSQEMHKTTPMGMSMLQPKL